MENTPDTQGSDTAINRLKNITNNSYANYINVFGKIPAVSVWINTIVDKKISIISHK